MVLISVPMHIDGVAHCSPEGQKRGPERGTGEGKGVEKGERLRSWTVLVMSTSVLCTSVLCTSVLRAVCSGISCCVLHTFVLCPSYLVVISCK